MSQENYNYQIFNSLCKCLLPTNPNKQQASYQSNTDRCFEQNIGSLILSCEDTSNLSYASNIQSCTTHYYLNCSLYEDAKDKANILMITMASLGLLVTLSCIKIIGSNDELRNRIWFAIRPICSFMARLCEKLFECLCSLLACPCLLLGGLCKEQDNRQMDQHPIDIDEHPNAQGPRVVRQAPPVAPNRRRENPGVTSPRIEAQVPPIAPNRRIDNSHANSFNFELSNLDTMSEQKECTICLTPFAEAGYGEITTLPCLHVFHKECVDPWLAQSRNCPVCRDDTIPRTPVYDLEMSLFPSQI